MQFRKTNAIAMRDIQRDWGNKHLYNF